MCLFAGAYKRFGLFAVKAVDEIIYRRFSVRTADKGCMSYIKIKGQHLSAIRKDGILNGNY